MFVARVQPGVQRRSKSPGFHPGYAFIPFTPGRATLADVGRLAATIVEA